MNNNFFTDIDPEDTFLDSSNLPGFDQSSVEGKIVKSLSSKEVYTIGIIFTLILIVFISKLFSLQVLNSEHYYQLSQNNRLYKPVLFAERGIITDRLGRELVWNEPQEHSSGHDRSTYSLRKYTDLPGLSHLLGFVSYPERDSAGNWWRTNFIPSGGVEQSFDHLLRGVNGHQLIEIDASQNIVSSGATVHPINGETLILSIDAEMTSKLHNSIKNGVNIAGFVAGAGVIMDVNNGEILAITSYPEYNLNTLTDGSDRNAIANYSSDYRKPFLNRPVQGLYAPGSIIKPYMAVAALEEGIITEYTKILSTGVLKIPNRYHPGQYSTFRDWYTGFGLLNIYEAMKMSSSIFFYVIGGGFESQKGLGIDKIYTWAGRFGFGRKTGIALPGEESGVVPNPQWKKDTFGEDAEWNLGNTYHSAIGQYGWLVTPVQSVKYIASVANGAILHSPILKLGATSTTTLVPIQDKNLQIVREGMRSATVSGTARALNIPGIDISSKTGTAQIGSNNEYMNSWIVGFWPYDEPRFAFAVVLERSPADTLRGAAPAMHPFFNWIASEHSNDYAIGKYPK